MGVTKWTSAPQNVRLRPDEQQQLEDLAAELGLSKSALLRASAVCALPRLREMDAAEVARLGSDDPGRPRREASATT